MERPGREGDPAFLLAWLLLAAGSVPPLVLAAPAWTISGTVAAADGSGQTRLTTSSGVDGEPAWFRTGARLAFSSLRDGNPEIYAMNANGSSQTRLTFHSSLDLAPDP